VSARILDLLFLHNTYCCNPLRKLVSIYLILCKRTKQHSQTPDPIPGRHAERAWSSVDQNLAQRIVNGSSVEESECNIASGSQHGNRTPSMRDLPEHNKEKTVPQDKAEDAARTPTSTRQAIEELLVLLRARELRENGVQGNFHSSPQYGAGYFAQPYSHSDPAHISTLTPEYKTPCMFAAHHVHQHYHYNAPNVSPPSIINNINTGNIDNNNISNNSCSSESGEDEREPYFPNG